MAGNGQTLLQIVGNGWKGLEVAGYGLKRLEMARNCQEQLYTGRHGKCTEQAERCSGNVFLARVNFWSVHFLSQMAKISSGILYQAVKGKIILGWVIFPGYVTLPSHGNFTQTDIVYPAWVWLPSLGTVTKAG